MPETGWVLMDGAKTCIIKGKTQKHLMELNEHTRKEIVCYPTEKSAVSALKRSVITLSPAAASKYPDIYSCGLHPVAIEEAGVLE